MEDDEEEFEEHTFLKFFFGAFGLLCVGALCVFSLCNYIGTMDIYVVTETGPEEVEVVDPVDVTEYVTTESETKYETCVRVAREYNENHVYIKNTWDCDCMSMDVWNILKANGIEADIIVGNVEIGRGYNMSEINHAWVLAYLDDRTVAIECTSGNVYERSERPEYFSGFRFDDPDDWREMQAMENKLQYISDKYNATAAEYTASRNEYMHMSNSKQKRHYNELLEQYNECERIKMEYDELQNEYIKEYENRIF